MATNQKSLLHIGLESLADFVFPPLCLICSGENLADDALVCDSCWSKATGDAHLLCLSCRRPLGDAVSCEECDSSSVPVAVLGHYQDPLQEIIHQFKYSGYSKLGESLSNRLIDNHIRIFERLLPNLAVPIPLDSYRLRRRGFNQAAVLSDIVGKRLQIETAEQLLVKSRKTKDQTRLDFEKRAENLKGAFTVTERIAPEAKIILIDDVFTTGATLREGCRAIDAAGGKVVMAAAIAVADR